MLFCRKKLFPVSRFFSHKKKVKQVNQILVAVFTLLFLQVPFNAHSQFESSKFTRITTNEGLSQGHVNAILKDREGFMWFGTDGGLDKYDGYTFTVYRHDSEKPASISSDIIADVLEDYGGNLWVATRGGVDKLDRKKNIFIHYSKGIYGVVNNIFQDSRRRIWVGSTDGLYMLDNDGGIFTSYKNNSNDKNSLSNNYIYRIAEDNNGNLWIATKNGLNKFNPLSKQFTTYKNNSSNRESIGSDWIRSVYKDNNGNIWAGTLGGGISMYNPQHDNFINYRHDENNSKSISLNDILSFAQDGKGNLWVGTENGGISVLDYLKKTFSNYVNDPYNANSLGNNSIYSLYKDDLANMWIGTYSEGVNFLPAIKEKFVSYTSNLGKYSGLNNENVLAIAGDDNGNIWMGTDGGGLNGFNESTQKFSYYKKEATNANGINSNYVITVIKVGKDLLALGLLRGGFDFFNTKTRQFAHHFLSTGKSNATSSLTVTILLKSNDGNLWVGTWGEGLYYYDIKKNTITHYSSNANDSRSISSNFTSCLFEDSEGTLWVGSSEGLDHLNKDRKIFTRYKHSDNDKNSLSQSATQYVFEDHAKNIWIGTSGGLNLFDREKQTFTAFTEKDGLANNMIKSILEDSHGNLWLATSAGLTRFNTQTKNFRNYNTSDGLQGKEFKPSSCYLAADGRMFFGGTKGFNAFHPDSLQDNTFIPPVYITHFYLFNKEVMPGGLESPLQQYISEAKNITLSYDQSVFSFEFAALNYILPQKNQYAYKLENFDKAWNYSGNVRSATYTHLDPGKYIFRVKASNNDGLWNETGTSVTITILPPFWMTWWFRTGVLLVISSCAVGFYLVRMNTVKSQKLVLQQKVNEQTAQLLTLNEEERKARLEADEANRAKGVFLATMSHEIRTPMNGVIGMASLLMQTELTSEQKIFTKTITTCGESLLSVINDILDFSKIDSGKMDLENKLFYLPACIEEALNIFLYKASESGVKLVYHIDKNVPLEIMGDSLRLRQILINLVGNAMKFTAAGQVSINVCLLETHPGEPMQISFEVRDTGIGIPADKIKRLFKAFSQVDSSTTRKYGGTGLGLVICDKLVTLMGGSIKVESEPGKGTAFTFNIKTDAKEQYTSGEYNVEQVNKINGPQETKQEQIITADFSKQYPLRILVAEDNAVNLMIVNKILNKLGYTAESAKNGHEVLQMLTHQQFDLIFMDVQMPEMDGLEAATFIRKNNSAQPVIIAMTANVMQGDREECLDAGMNDYLSKPINFDSFVKKLQHWAEKIQVTAN